LTTRQRAALLASLDVIIPAGLGMPSAGQAGCLEYLAGVSRADEGLASELAKSLDAVQAAAKTGFGRDFEALELKEQVATLQGLESSEVPAFRGLRDAVYEAYYTRPDVRKRLGHEFYPPERPGPLPAPFEPSVLARVRLMPRLYRTPGE
jgi:hypothetical protein